MSQVDGRTLRAPLRLETDVVVVGSGPAGAAAARVLAQGGARVVVLEAGPVVRPEQFELSAFASMSQCYRGLGATTAWGSTMTPLVQGRMVGGSSPINGAICWRLPRDVYEGWCHVDPVLERRLPWERVERVTEEIEARLRVARTEAAVAGRKNELLAIGAEAIGLEHRPIRRNVLGCRGLGRCMQGCPGGHKQSVDLTLLQDAIEAGAVLYSSVEVSGVELSGRRAVGVRARAAGGGEVRVRAQRAVVVAASAVQSPVLLLRSGLTRGPVGHGFQGHPGVAMAGRFREPVRMWEGATQGHEVIGLRREGLKFEALGFDLTLLAARLPGVGSAWSARLHELDHWLEWGAAVRSTSHGRVRSVFGRPVVTWSPSALDLDRYRRGLRVMAQMMFAAGAEVVAPGVRGLPELLHDPSQLGCFKTDAPRSAAAYPAAMTHLFGTCRLGSDPGRSVVRADLRHHDIEGLYVADSSVFPSNTGVNPQISIMALATICGENVLDASLSG